MDAVAATVLGLAGLLGLISLLPPLAERLRVPYTVLLAVLGCALGATVGFDLGGLGIVGDFLFAVDAIEVTATAFLTIFLPVLLFDTGLSLDARALLEDLAPILLLAVVAVVVATVVAGFAVWGAAGWLAPGLTLAACLLLASIVATTDPAAVVAIFREVGAPQRLSNLVEGESLLNDAAAIALFGLFLAVVTGAREPDLEEGAWIFFREFLGGSAFGFLAGRLAAAVAIRLGDLRSAEITLSLALPYLTYVLAQSYLYVSGVVAVVVAALAFGAYGRVGLAPASWQALTAIWQQLGFWASSLVFVLASMLVPRTLQSLTPADAGLLLVLVAAALVARAVVLYGLLPGLSALGLAQRVSGPYKAVMLWGGLRGAVTLALALGVTESYAVAPEIKRHVAVLATGFVLFTLFVQAPTLRPLLRWFRLDRLPPAERALRARVMALSFDDIVDRLHTAA
ncbi:MAG TPA: cation:proton antiporter, partial [Geminicoccaceae bacterium]|nr:cation:proton antiporter [Geminicoccaceae bacterium]